MVTCIYSHQNGARGQPTIIAYDASRKLISVTYEMQLITINDLTDATLPGAATLQCNVSVTGSFKDLPVE